MIERELAAGIAGSVLLAPMHGAPPTPVPHWLALLAAVPALWVLVGAAVVAVDRLCGRARR